MHKFTFWWINMIKKYLFYHVVVFGGVWFVKMASNATTNINLVCLRSNFRHCFHFVCKIRGLVSARVSITWAHRWWMNCEKSTTQRLINWYSFVLRRDYGIERLNRITDLLWNLDGFGSNAKRTFYRKCQNWHWHTIVLDHWCYVPKFMTVHTHAPATWNLQFGYFFFLLYNFLLFPTNFACCNIFF